MLDRERRREPDQRVRWAGPVEHLARRPRTFGVLGDDGSRRRATAATRVTRSSSARERSGRSTRPDDVENRSAKRQGLRKGSDVRSGDRGRAGRGRLGSEATADGRLGPCVARARTRSRRRSGSPSSGLNDIAVGAGAVWAARQGCLAGRSGPPGQAANDPGRGRHRLARVRRRLGLGGESAAGNDLEDRPVHELGLADDRDRRHTEGSGRRPRNRLGLGRRRLVRRKLDVSRAVACPAALRVWDLPLRTAGSGTLEMTKAIEYIFRKRGFRAGKYRVDSYQSCDDSTSQIGVFDTPKCAANAKSYAAGASVIGVIGTYNSGCAQSEIPFLNRAPNGPLYAMVSPANSYVGLTRPDPFAPKGALASLYPTGVRNYAGSTRSTTPRRRRLRSSRRVSALGRYTRSLTRRDMGTLSRAGSGLLRTTSGSSWSDPDRLGSGCEELHRTDRPRQAFRCRPGLLRRNPVRQHPHAGEGAPRATGSSGTSDRTRRFPAGRGTCSGRSGRRREPCM